MRHNCRHSRRIKNLRPKIYYKKMLLWQRAVFDVEAQRCEKSRNLTDNSWLRVAPDPSIQGT